MKGHWKPLLLGLALLGGAGHAGTAQAEEPRLVSSRLTLIALDGDVDTTDFSTGLHLGLSVRSPELVPGLRAEAELSLFVAAGAQGGLSLRDNASFVRLAWRPESWAEGSGLALTVLPLSSTRLHLGYEFPATWGRFLYTFRTNATGSSGVPGVELRLTQPWGYVFAAAKSGLDTNALSLEAERLAMGLAGAGVDVLPQLRLEAAGALAGHGQIPGFAAVGVEGHSRTLGVSGRLLYHQGGTIGPSVDFTLYQQDPAVYETLFAPESYPGGLAVHVSLEGTHLEQDLVAPGSSTPGQTDAVGATALALQGRLKVDRLRLHALALYRSASFLVSEVPGFPAFRALASDSVQADTSLTAGVDYHLPALGLTPGFLMRAVWPAAFQNGGSLEGGGLTPGLTTVLRGPTSISILPEGRGRRPLLLAKATARWDLGTRAAALGEVFYTHDPNRTTFQDGPEGVAGPVFEPASSVGFSLLLQARF